ncbi:MAG: TaqI-like C-terminal specificity domain-containing protein, partial [Thermodesulfovibrionales bacterium]|nr:TaqI-like C-terminal specificity domain-containing protein [Thermodesulfovibrionales bacterium]
LVHTVDFISDRIVSFLAGYPENPVIKKIHKLRDEILAEIKRQGVRIDESKLTEVNLIKRMVMKRCIYGVDLNDMAVELAKLSLWLDSFTLGAPLSFLDHHLKCGNSLIGTNIEELEKALTGHLFAINLEPLKRAIRDMIFISDLPDATMEQVRESYKKFGEANRGLEGYRILLDMLVTEHFGLSDAKKILVSDFDKIDLNNLHASISRLPDKDRKLIEHAKVITKEKKFFHWEIEFPEVFYERTAEFGQKIDKKTNPGFDCVIGNPPYIQLSMDETLRNSMQAYLLERFVFSMGRLNTFGFFTKLGLELSKLSGLVSMIIPNTFLTMPYYSDFRENILQSARIDSFLLFDSLPFEDAVVENIVYVFQKTTDNTKINKNKVTIYEASEILKGTSKPVRAIPQSLYQQLFEKAFNPYLDDQLIRLFDKLNANNTLLTSLVEINQAIALKHDRDKYLTPNPQGLQYKKVLDGRDIDRYSLDFSGTYLKYSRDAIHSCKREDIFTSPEKLFFRRVGDKIIATVDNEQHYALNTLVVINRKVSSANLMFLLSLLNSRLLTWYFNSFLKSIKDVFSEIQARQMEQLPIPRISFTTPEKERKEFFKEAVKLYEHSKYDDVIKWAENEIALSRSDTIHDFLAYLAEQMIELNKFKNDEVKGFLKWLEREIGAEIDTLANKTAIKEYHDNDFTHLLDVLKKNKSKISVDPSNRKTQELLEKYFIKSMSVLQPLKEKIKATDNLIDQIVYKLYNLTPEEIAIVEGKGMERVRSRQSLL